MKRTLLTIAAIAAAVLTITGCGTASRARAVSVSFADFRPYISSGFWISPDPYTGKHEPIGTLCIRIKPAIQQTTDGDGVYMSTAYTPEIIGADEMLEMAYKAAKEKGANGIANYKMEIETTAIMSHGISTSTVTAYIITGLLIKIPD